MAHKKALAAGLLEALLGLLPTSHPAVWTRVHDDAAKLLAVLSLGGGGVPEAIRHSHVMAYLDDLLDGPLPPPECGSGGGVGMLLGVQAHKTPQAAEWGDLFEPILPGLVAVLVACDDPVALRWTTSALMVGVGGEEPNEAALTTVERAGGITALLGCVRYDEPELSAAAMDTLGNFAASSSDHVRSLLRSGILPVLVQVLAGGCMKAQIAAAWTMSNIAADEERHGEVLMNTPGFIPALMHTMDAAAGVPGGKLSRECIWVATNFMEPQKGALAAPLFAAGVTQRLMLCAKGANVMTVASAVKSLSGALQYDLEAAQGGGARTGAVGAILGADVAGWAAQLVQAQEDDDDGTAAERERLRGPVMALQATIQAAQQAGVA